MAPNFTKMLLSWVGFFALFAALAMANPVKRGDVALFESSLNHLHIDKGLIPMSNLSAAAPAAGCGLFSTADRKNVESMIRSLEIQEKTLRDCVGYFVPPRSCFRRNCVNTSGLYLCNDNHWNIWVDCHVMIPPAKEILNECCGGGRDKTGLSGQRFMDGGWNVIIAYANCNHSPYTEFPAPGPSEDPWGPNGSCFP